MKDDIKDDIREDMFNMLRILYTDNSPTQRDLSNHLGMSLGKTNYLLKVIIKRGLISIKHFTEGGQQANKLKYYITKKGIETKLSYTYHFLKKKEEEYLRLKQEAENIATGGLNVK